MPKSSPFKITAAYIEFLHDKGIEISWPGVQPVGPYDCIDLNLLESASEQPFQAGFGVEFYPTTFDKAACLFFSIAGGHIFSNGNKRTAVLALDQFLYANGIYLSLSNAEIQRLAEETASHRERNEDQADVKARISQLIRTHSLPFAAWRKIDLSVYRGLLRLRKVIREVWLNQPGIRPKQAERGY